MKFFYFLMATTLLSNVYAGLDKCNASFKIKNPHDVKANVDFVEYKVAGKTFKESVNYTVDANSSDKSSKQRLGGADDGQKISELRVGYKLYTKHQSTNKWSDQKTTAWQSFGKKCDDGDTISLSLK